MCLDITLHLHRTPPWRLETLAHAHAVLSESIDPNGRQVSGSESGNKDEAEKKIKIKIYSRFQSRL